METYHARRQGAVPNMCSEKTLTQCSAQTDEDDVGTRRLAVDRSITPTEQEALTDDRVTPSHVQWRALRRGALGDCKHCETHLAYCSSVVQNNATLCEFLQSLRCEDVILLNDKWYILHIRLFITTTLHNRRRKNPQVVAISVSSTYRSADLDHRPAP